MIVDEHLARRLVDAQFPQWTRLRLTPVAAQGWDNRTFRLGDTLSVSGAHNFFRGGPLTVYAEETRHAADALGTAVPRAAVLAVWDDAVATDWTGDPVWVHGDVAAGNLLVRDGRLAAVIDFGSSGVGDPACDTVIA